ncbi:hypothetical protein [Polyangium sp. y55x31]|uniref:hypothetical protein n=1 Tax=Polyangium sp. y55x31 TaxID=3042688 RepID=UPI0024821DDA|nr:hypothetical protein [Polyangium sp. y55x31]MDI1475411.1 hypothetical protein [Polyangium sp. y55x31]
MASLFVTACGSSAGPGKTADSAGPESERTDKARECDAVIAIINKGIKDLNAPSNEGDDPTGAKQLRAMADTLDAVARDIEAVDVTRPELGRKVTDYGDMARDTAKAARDLARASEAKDARGIKAAQSALDTAVKREDPLVDSINAYCQAKQGP